MSKTWFVASLLLLPATARASGKNALELRAPVAGFLGAVGAAQDPSAAKEAAETLLEAAPPAPEVAGAAVSSVREDILGLSYGGLVANAAYTTGWQTVRSAPRRVGVLKVSFDLTGYCNPVTRLLSYQSSPGGSPRYPVNLGNGEYKVDDAVYAIKYDFTQTVWHGAFCNFHFSADGASSSGSFSDRKAIVWRSKDAASSGRTMKLLASTLELADKADYTAMFPALDAFTDAAESLATEVESGAGPDRAARMFRKVSEGYDRLLTDFREIHNRQQNLSMDKAFEGFRKAFYSLEQGITSQIGSGRAASTAKD